MSNPDRRTIVVKSKLKNLCLTLAVAACFGPVSAALAHHEPGHVGTQSMQSQLAEAQTCSANCTKQKDACMAAGAREGNFGTRYVPPEVVRDCSDGFRECQKRCK